MNKYSINEFKFNRLFNRMEIIASRIKDDYVEYRRVENGRFRWVRRYELVWTYYKKAKRKFGYHIHHKNMNKKDDRPSNLTQITRDQHVAIHGIVYSKEGKGGSARNTGIRHTEATKQAIAESMVGNNTTDIPRTGQWGNRISVAKKRQSPYDEGLKQKGITMRNIVKLYCMDQLSYRSVANRLDISRQVVGMRLDWFCEDNFGGKLGLLELRRLMVNKKLDDCIFYDEEFRLEDTVEYKVIQERLVKGTIACDLAEKYSITTDEVNGMVERFQELNGMENMHLYQMRKELHKHGANTFKFTHNVT